MVEQPIMASKTNNILMVYPRFSGGTFWNFAETCKAFEARYPAAPLGLITVAALLPPSWDVRLINRNTEELTQADLESVSYTHLRAHETRHDLVCRLLLEKKKTKK